MADLAYKPLLGKRVVVTRAVEQSEPLMNGLRESGAQPLLVPMVSFAPPDDFGPLDDALLHGRQFDWLLLTSSNALRALQERCVTLELSIAEVFAGVNIAVVGPGSADAARQVGLDVLYVASLYQGVALAKELGEQLRSKRIFLPRSDIASRDMVEVLVNHGAHVTEVIAYKTELPSEAEREKLRAKLHEGVEAVLFFSPSAVHHFQSLLGDAEFARMANTSTFAAIGPVTKAALQEAGVRRILVAESATVPSLLSGLSQHFAATPQPVPAGAKRA